MLRKSAGTATSIVLLGMVLAAPPPALASAAPQHPSKSAASKLTITVAGLPSTVRGRVKVLGPGGFRRTIKVNGTKTLSNLTSGSYRLKAKAVSTPSGRAKATKQTRKVKVQITAKKGAQVLVLYVTPGTV